MPNTALIEARRRAHLSQRGLAAQIQRAGWRRGLPNGCTRELVHKWEHGLVRRPQSLYVVLLEDVLGEPVESLGFDADLSYGIDREQALAESGLDEVFPLPAEPDRGPLTGIWRSEYTYPSSGRRAEFTSQHYVMALQYGARLMVRSLPKQASTVAMDLTANGQVLTGTWTERTRPDGHYRGAIYVGALQLLEREDGMLAGTWVGYGKGGEINTGPWSLTYTDDEVTQAAVDRWDRPLE